MYTYILSQRNLKQHQKPANVGLDIVWESRGRPIDDFIQHKWEGPLRLCV